MKSGQGIVFILLLTAFIMPTACGKKGPPFLPDMEISLRVEKLQAESENGTVVLKGTVVDTEGRKTDFSNVTGCRLYHACYPLEDPPCKGCPIQYGEFKEIKGKVITEETFSYDFPMEKKKGIHFFKVRLVGPNGEVGPSSDRAQLIIVEH